MGFSPKTVEHALIACRRCCCLCQKFCGLNIHIHHIVPRGEGGTDDPDNAIPLCFDCHATVHQQSKAPMGRRFTVSELRRHRDSWYEKGVVVSYEQLASMKNELLNLINSLQIPELHNTLHGLSVSVEKALQAFQLEDRRKELAANTGVSVLSDPGYYAKLGEMALEYEDYERAVELLEEAVKLDKKSPGIYFNLFKARLRRSEWDEAVIAYRKAVDLDSNVRILPEKYEILTVLGCGGQAVVYLAQTAEGSKVVVRVFRGRSMTNIKHLASSIKESALLSDTDNPIVGRILDQGFHQGRFYTVMPYYSAYTLDRWFEEVGKDNEKLLQVLHQLACGIEYMHSIGVVHRDIKPANILVDVSSAVPRPILIDFALALRVQPGATTLTSDFAGTVAYAPPEAFDRLHVVSAATDVYSLGVVLYLLLVGSLPDATGAGLQRLSLKWPTLSSLLRRMLATDPSERPSIQEVRLFFENLLETLHKEKG